MALRRIEAGFYETPDGKHRIVRTEWDGPAGGKRYIWEIVSRDAYGWVITGDFPPGRTLRESRGYLDA